MIHKWKVEQFGVAIAGVLSKFKNQIIDLDPDLVQLPLHLNRPAPDDCRAIIDSDTKLVGKFILPKGVNHIPYIEIKKVFEEYKGLVQIWDFGGEPETRPKEPGCRFSGSEEQFTRQAQIFQETGKSIDPDNVVGGCGWITPTFNGSFGNEDRSGFFRRCLDLGIGDFLDFISLNFYIYGYGGIKNILAGISKVNEVLAWNHVEKPVVVAECGVPCAGDPKFLHIIQTPERQATSLVKQHILFNSVGIDYAIWFALKHLGWGLLDTRGKRRPSYYAMRTIKEFLKGAIFKRQLKAYPSRTVEERWGTDQINWFVFERNAKEIHVIWTTEGLEIDRLFPFTDVEVFDIVGQPVDVSRGSIRITDSPLYFVADPGELHSYNFLLL